MFKLLKGQVALWFRNNKEYCTNSKKWTSIRLLGKLGRQNCKPSTIEREYNHTVYEANTAADKETKKESWNFKIKFQEEFLKKELSLIEHRIQLTNPKPNKQRYHLQNLNMQQVINEEVDRMLDEDIIEPSNSQGSLPKVMTR